MHNQIQLNLTGRVPIGAIHATDRGLAVAALFGIGLERGGEQTLFENVPLSVAPADLLLITGPSGAGKSTLLRAAATALREFANLHITQLEDIPLPADRAVIDCFSGTLPEALAHLARAGLSEAHLCLRAPAELSEGQRFRYRLAQFFASDSDILIADEFAATLDRVTARVVAHQLGKFICTSRRAAIVATTHEDLAEDLYPTIHIWKGFGTATVVQASRLPVAAPQQDRPCTGDQS